MTSPEEKGRESTLFLEALICHDYRRLAERLLYARVKERPQKGELKGNTGERERQAGYSS